MTRSPAAALPHTRHLVLVENDWSTPHQIAVRFNNGSGGFGAPVVYSSLWFPVAVLLADIDGANGLDLIVVHEQSADLTVRLNQGDGRFGPESRFPLSGWPRYVAAADLDGQDRVELAVTAGWRDPFRPAGINLLLRCPVSVCDASALSEVARLLGVKATNLSDAVLSWDQAAGASDGYDVWYVPQKASLPACRACPGSVPVGGCQPTGAVANVSCTHTGAVPGPGGDIFFYNVRAVCGGSEGPR